VPLVDDLFRDLDARWGRPTPAKIRLRIIGSAALMLQTDYERGTTDSDVLETTNLTDGVRKRILDLAGEGTTIHQRHRLYIQIVPSGVRPIAACTSSSVIWIVSPTRASVRAEPRYLAT
jgi:hypothetical protein